MRSRIETLTGVARALASKTTGFAQISEERVGRQRFSAHQFRSASPSLRMRTTRKRDLAWKATPA